MMATIREDGIFEEVQSWLRPVRTGRHVDESNLQRDC